MSQSSSRGTSRRGLLVAIGLFVLLSCAVISVLGALAYQRLFPPPPPPTVGTPLAGPGQVARAGWTSYTSGDRIGDMEFGPDGSLWTVGDGAVVHWNVKDLTYVLYSGADG